MSLPAAQLHLPKPVWVLLALYFAASLAHFSHNAEYIAPYPNLPASLTRENVWLAWLAVTAVGVAGLAALRWRWSLVGVLLIAAYGALGLGGLAHYTLALCSEHTLVTNLTIWSEATLGLALLFVASIMAARRTVRPGQSVTLRTASPGGIE